MRDGLASLKSKSGWFTATVSRYGADPDGVPTVCIKDIKHKGELVADHCWLTLGENIKGGIQGKVQFFAKVSRYSKPAKSIFEDKIVDYRFSNIKDYERVNS